MTHKIDAEAQITASGFVATIQFTLTDFRVVALFGRSGAGKSTILRWLAGLIPASKGRLSVDGEIWQAERKFVSPHLRGVGYVPQEPSLFPHLNVEGNLRFGYDRVPSSVSKQDFEQVILMMGLSDFTKRSPLHLSGGERRRVAIARAVLSSPRLLLLDEPLTALDHESKQEVLVYLQKVKAEFGIPMIYVSHSRDEVSVLADFVIQVEKGRGQSAVPVTEFNTKCPL